MYIHILRISPYGVPYTYGSIKDMIRMMYGKYGKADESCQSLPHARTSATDTHRTRQSLNRKRQQDDGWPSSAIDLTGG
jgi:nitroimidazol reductase NimA-like FMN-containing flavoprotein (pyridoxamine 5'-phosphate oxidase superfamily)